MELIKQNTFYTKHDPIEVENDEYFHLYGLTRKERESLEEELNYWRKRLVENEEKILFFFTIQFNFMRTRTFGFNSLEAAHKDTREWTRSFMRCFTRIPFHFIRYVYPKNSKKLHCHGFLITNGGHVGRRGYLKGIEATHCISLIQKKFESAKKEYGTFAKATLDIQVYDKEDNAIDYVLRKQNKDIDPRLIKNDFETSWFNGSTGQFTFMSDWWGRSSKNSLQEIQNDIF